MPLLTIDRLRRWSALPLKSFEASRLRLVKVAPCYFIRDSLTSSSIVVDCGLGTDADFSCDVMRRYGARCYGFDPTRKHGPALEALARASLGRFRFYPFAVADRDDRAVFHESAENVSGSLSASHVNVRRDRTRSYQVDCITLRRLLEIVGTGSVDLLKLDIEGAEYGVLEAAPPELLCSIGQIVVEFHHQTLHERTRADTLRVIGKLRALGFEPFTRDQVNYLFFRP